MKTPTAFDLHSLVRELKLNRGVPLGALDGLPVKLSRFSFHPRWEMHPNGDELLYVVEGELELTLLGEESSPRSILAPGGLTIVPRGVWHSPQPKGSVTLLHLADYRGTKVSNAADPRPRRS
jgi:mannose-6-phosphate isomerase-like protein (cupin superfamily)